MEELNLTPEEIKEADEIVEQMIAQEDLVEEHIRRSKIIDAKIAVNTALKKLEIAKMELQLALKNLENALQ